MLMTSYANFMLIVTPIISMPMQLIKLENVGMEFWLPFAFALE
jgi:hypothetical protein